MLFPNGVCLYTATGGISDELVAVGRLRKFSGKWHSFSYVVYIEKITELLYYRTEESGELKGKEIDCLSFCYANTFN